MRAIITSIAFLLSVAPVFGQASVPTPEKGYALSVFTTGVTGQYTAPDSIAVYKDHVYIGYGDNNDPTGADGKSNMIIEYNRAGRKVYSFTVKGHNDGLKLNPYTHKLWVMQNEDANRALSSSILRPGRSRSTPLRRPRLLAADTMTSPSITERFSSAHPIRRTIRTPNPQSSRPNSSTGK
jgi:hypothetical protein